MNTAIKREGVFLSIIIAIVFSMVFMVQGVIKADEEPEILSFTYGEGMTGWGGTPPTFFDFKLDGEIKEDEIIISIPKEHTEHLKEGLDFGPNFMEAIFQIEATEGATIEGEDNGNWATLDVANGRFVEGIFEDVDIPYKLLVKKDGMEREYTVIFKTWEPKVPEISSDAQATILGSGIQLSSMADLLVSGEYNKGKVASLTDGKLTYDIVDSRGVEDTYKLQYTVSNFVHEDGETTLNFVDESFTNEAKSVETVDPLNKTNFDGEINLSNLDLEDGFVKAGNYSATATIEIVEVPNP